MDANFSVSNLILPLTTSDIDFDNNNRISFIEYLCLQFKTMILAEFYKYHEAEPVEDLSKGGVGITGGELFDPRVLL